MNDEPGAATMINRKISLILIVVAITGVLNTGIAAAASPQQTIESLVDEALAILNNGTLNWQDKKAEIRSVILNGVDLPAMSQRILGKNWGKTDEEQRERFIQLFTDLLETTYIDRIEAYSDQRMELVRERTKGDRAIVDTLFITKKKQIPINYKLTRNGEKWLIFDMVIEEVSLVSNYRETYGEIIMNDGMDGLLTRMEDKVRELKAAREGG